MDEYTKHTIVIYSPPTSGIELSALARDAEEGDSYCASYEMKTVTDADLPEDAHGFFHAFGEEKA